MAIFVPCTAYGYMATAISVYSVFVPCTAYSHKLCIYSVFVPCTAYGYICTLYSLWLYGYSYICIFCISVYEERGKMKEEVRKDER